MVATDFGRLITLLRKERGLSQKSAAAELGISQALLSHYEKGIRECGLSFVVRAADFYQVSADYLLGRTADRNGATIGVDDIPDGAAGKESGARGGIYATLNKKLIANSLNIIFDQVQKSNNKGLISEVSSFFMLAVYRMFRILHGANPKNPDTMFSVPRPLARGMASAAMEISEAKCASIAQGKSVLDLEGLKDTEGLLMSPETLAKDYPMYASSLLNVIQSSEGKMNGKR